MSSHSELKAITLELLAYCRENDWAGHDPYDALNSKWLTASSLLDFHLVRLVMTQALKRLPWNLRPLLAIPKTQNPKALALFLSAVLKLSKIGLISGDVLARYLADRLEVLASDAGEYWSWGYSFPWQTRTIVVPRGSPNLVCTIFVANSLIDLYEFSGAGRYLAMAVGSAEYLQKELCWFGGESIASMAYPLATSRSRIHNANLLGAALLCRVARCAGQPKFFDAALKIARYSAGQQREDGSWPYGEDPKQTWIDNFHTGYNLSALRSISRDMETGEFDEAIRAGFGFYRSHFIRADGAARYFHDRTYPIDIHCVAQTILTLMEFKHLDPGNQSLAGSVVDWAVAHMLDKRGYFYYRVLPLGRIKTSYMRWSQAWMLLALATFLQEAQQQQ